MANFDVSIVYCCPCVLMLVKKEINKKKFLSQALLTDFIKAKFDNAILIKLLLSIECLFISCFKDLQQCLYLDYEWCNHYSRKRDYFSYKTEDFYLVSKCKICSKNFLINNFSNFYHLLL